MIRPPLRAKLWYIPTDDQDRQPAEKGSCTVTGTNIAKILEPLMYDAQEQLGKLIYLIQEKDEDTCPCTNLFITWGVFNCLSELIDLGASNLDAESFVGC